MERWTSKSPDYDTQIAELIGRHMRRRLVARTGQYAIETPENETRSSGLRVQSGNENLKFKNLTQNFLNDDPHWKNRPSTLRNS